MKCVIFGGGGFIGSAIVDRLILEGHNVRIFERPRVMPYRDVTSNPMLEWITGDFGSISDVTNAVDGMDVVIHLVSSTLPKSSNEDPVYDVQSNLISTLQLLNTMVSKKVPRIVFISSGGTVYGPPLYLPIDEQHITDPFISYGITKLAIEKYLLMYERFYGIKANILRVSNPFGERQRVETAQGAVGVFIHRALQNKTIEIWGDGSVIRDYIYVGDVADAFSKAVKYTGKYSVFNIGSGHGVSLNELISELEIIVGKPIICQHLPSRSIDVPVSILSNQLARDELGWIPRTPLSEGLEHTVRWAAESMSES